MEGKELYGGAEGGSRCDTARYDRSFSCIGENQKVCECGVGKREIKVQNRISNHYNIYHYRGALGAWQISSYDKSVLEIYAGQQDAYVQLVLDQINLQANRSDDEIITEILGSLDSSSGKYWTLSKEQALLFVKDVMETNRYKDLPLKPIIFRTVLRNFSKILRRTK